MNMQLIDLDAERAKRAAEREGKGIDGGIRLGGQIIATLPVELPVDVLAPLQTIDTSITLILRSAMSAYKAQGEGDAAAAWDSTQLIVDLLALTPTLPTDMIAVLHQCGENLFGTEGYTALRNAHLSLPDVGVLAKGVFAFYGMTLGEASTSPESSENDGATLSSTSPDTSDSTPEGSTATETTPTSLAPAAS